MASWRETARAGRRNEQAVSSGLEVVRQGSSDGALAGNDNGEESTASEPRDGHVAADVEAGWKGEVEMWLWLVRW